MHSVVSESLFRWAGSRQCISTAQRCLNKNVQISPNVWTAETIAVLPGTEATLHKDPTVSVQLQDLPQPLLGSGHPFLGPLAFRGLIADGCGVGGVPFGGVQWGGHGGVTVLVVCPWAGGVAQGAGSSQAQPLIVPGLTAAVALAVHGALVPRNPPLVL